MLEYKKQARRCQSTLFGQSIRTGREDAVYVSQRLRMGDICSQFGLLFTAPTCSLIAYSTTGVMRRFFDALDADPKCASPEQVLIFYQWSGMLYFSRSLHHFIILSAHCYQPAFFCRSERRAFNECIDEYEANRSDCALCGLRFVVAAQAQQHAGAGRACR